MLWETSVPVKHLIKKASPALLNFTKSTGSRAENVRKFSLCARIRLHDYFRTAEGNKGEGSRSFPNKVLHILVVISATSFHRTIIQSVALIENLPLTTMEQQRVSNIALINTERAYANSVVNKGSYH